MNPKFGNKPISELNIDDCYAFFDRNPFRDVKVNCEQFPSSPDVPKEDTVFSLAEAIAIMEDQCIPKLHWIISLIFGRCCKMLTDVNIKKHQ